MLLTLRRVDMTFLSSSSSCLSVSSWSQSGRGPQAVGRPRRRGAPGVRGGLPGRRPSMGERQQAGGGAVPGRGPVRPGPVGRRRAGRGHREERRLGGRRALLPVRGHAGHIHPAVQAVPDRGRGERHPDGSPLTRRLAHTLRHQRGLPHAGDQSSGGQAGSGQAGGNAFYAGNDRVQLGAHQQRVHL